MGAVLLFVVALVIAACLVAYGWGLWEGLRPRLARWRFTGCWVYGDKIIAEGLADASTILFTHFTLAVNGTDVEMVVMEVHPGGSWAAQDLASLKAQRLAVP